MKRGLIMKVLYFDCFSGISGDMVLGALIDCGIDPERFISEINKLNIEGYSIKVTRGAKNGISGIDVDVQLDNDKDGDHGCHEGNDDHSAHDHDSHNKDHHHRNLQDIEYIIDNSALKQNVKDVSKKIFRKLAYAEAKVHGKPVEEVHFHEVGAVDSIIDITGTAICLDLLGVEKVIGSAVNTGMGFVKCQHGIIPVPGPAAMELLKGIPIYSLDIRTELVTPTGAAILSSLCESFGPIPQMTVESTGYGLGKKDIEIPNLLRTVIGEEKKNQDGIYVIECNIDDMNSEFYEYVMERLFEAGALDVFLTNIVMKKSRPAVKLSVIAESKYVETLTGIIFSETSTIGVRKYPVERDILCRKTVALDTAYGPVNIKVSYKDGNIMNYAPEYIDVKKAAARSGVPMKQVYFESVRAYLNLFDKNR